MAKSKVLNTAQAVPASRNIQWAESVPTLAFLGVAGTGIAQAVSQTDATTAVLTFLLGLVVAGALEG